MQAVADEEFAFPGHLVYGGLKGDKKETVKDKQQKE